MPSINVDLDYRDHPKTLTLVGKLGRGAECLPIWLWLYCGKYHAETGEITGPAADTIEARLRWWGRPGECIEALLDCVFLEKIEGGYRVHNWDRQAHLEVYKTRAKKARAAQLAAVAGGKEGDALYGKKDSASSQLQASYKPASSQLQAGPSIALQCITNSPLTPQGGCEESCAALFQNPDLQAVWDRWTAYLLSAVRNRQKVEAMLPLHSKFLLSLPAHQAIWSIERSIAMGWRKPADIDLKLVPKVDAKTLKAEEDEKKLPEQQAAAERLFQKYLPYWESLSQARRDEIAAEEKEAWPLCAQDETRLLFACLRALDKAVTDRLRFGDRIAGVPPVMAEEALALAVKAEFRIPPKSIEVRSLVNDIAERMDGKPPPRKHPGGIR